MGRRIAFMGKLYPSTMDYYQILRINSLEDKVGNATLTTTSPTLTGAVNELNDGKVSKSGDTMSGGLLVQMEATDAPYVSVNNGTYDVGIHIGSGGVNHGLYDFSLSKWLIYNNGTNTIVNGRASENVLKTGDVITGQLDAKNSNVTIGTTSNNGVTSSTYQGYRVVDNNGTTISHFFTGAYTNGDVKTYLQTYNTKTNGTRVDNIFSVGVKKDGTLFYEIGSPDNFRTALGLGAIATKSGATFTDLSVASFDFKATAANKAGSATASKSGWTFVCWVACYSTGHTLAGDCYFEYPQNATTNIWSRSGGFTTNSTIIKGLALFKKVGSLTS